MPDQAPLLFAELPTGAPHLRRAERLLLHSLPDDNSGKRLRLVAQADEPACKRLLKRGLVGVSLAPHAGAPRIHACRTAAGRAELARS